MTTSALIDVVINYNENVSAVDGDYASRRGRVLQWAQEVFDEVWNYREWWFSMTTAEVVVPANDGAASMPDDFQELTENGAVYSRTDRAWMREVSPQEILFDDEAGTVGVDPHKFSIFEMDDDGNKLIQVPTLTVDKTLVISYKFVPPTLVDATDDTNGLQFIPRAYHNTVILPGVLAKSARSKGDPADHLTSYSRGIAYMVARERHEKTSRKVYPRAVSNW